MNSLHFVKKQGNEILDFAADFAKLRITVFREFPYLYDGSLDYELEYIQTYAKSEKAMVFAVYDGDQMVGATTCVPLSEETPNVQQPFINAGLEVDKIFYFGESLLVKSYRGLGLGHRFFDERETFARSFENYELTAFCAVDRPMNHPLKPDDYHSNDGFWTKRNYKKQAHLSCLMRWQDLTETKESDKSLTFWTKEL